MERSLIETMVKAKVYIETSIVSYLVAARSQDLIQAAHQEATRQWWNRRTRFELFVSRFVTAEARRGDAGAAARRLEALRGVSMLSVGRDVPALATALVRAGALPQKARVDAVHVAIAATNGIDYLLTWNMRHLANAAIRGKIEEGCRRAGLKPPIICTPEELTEAPS
jgi:predicted nucleic acid-binding protein